MVINPLSASPLIETVRSAFGKIPDHRAANAKISLTDALMSGFAMFSLKDSSLLEFDERREKESNLKRIYGLTDIPCDTQLRTIVDVVSPAYLKPVFKDVLCHVRQAGVLAQLKFRGHYLVSLDGSGYFASATVGQSLLSVQYLEQIVLVPSGLQALVFDATLGRLLLP